MRSKRRRQLRTHRLLAVAILILLVLASAGGGAGYIALKRRADHLQASITADLQAGQRELEAGKASLTQANTKHDASLVAQAVAHFAEARNQFLAAAELADNSRLLRGLEHAPGAGDFARSRHVAVDGIAAMGAALSDAGQELSNLDGQLLSPSANGAAGRTLLTVLDQAHTSVAKVRLDFERAQKAAAQVDVQVVPPGQRAAFLKAREMIDSASAGLDEFERLVPVITDVLGGNGTRTYLVEQVNPIELRAGGGFIGSYSLLQANHGVLTVMKSGDAYDLADPRPLPGQPGFIPQPGPYREVIPDISWSFVDSNLFPDFPSNAEAADSFVQPRLGTRIDGVFAIDIYAVASMLKLTGPVQVPGYGMTLDANNFVPVVTRLDYSGSPIHKAILTALTGPLIAKISALPPDQWPALLAALNSIASERHLQAYFNNESVEAEVDRVGWSGRLKLDGSRDYMMEVESNYGSKANLFLTRQYNVVLTRSGSNLHHRVTVTLINRTPYGSYDRTYYHVDVRLLVGNDASSLSDNLTAVKYANPDPPSGAKVLDGWAWVQCCGSQDQAVFEYDTPWPASEKGPYEIYWQKQPGTLNDAVVVTWNGKTITGDLSQDRLISLTPNGVALAPGEPALATLPSSNFGGT